MRMIEQLQPVQVTSGQSVCAGEVPDRAAAAGPGHHGEPVELFAITSS